MVFISLGTINKKISFAIIAGIYELFANIFLILTLSVVVSVNSLITSSLCSLLKPCNGKYHFNNLTIIYNCIKIIKYILF